MGLGRLNPGCNCGCDVRVPVTDACRLAGQFWQPTSVSLSCQSFGGSEPSPCQQGWPSCGKMRFNPSTVTIQIPKYDSPDFQCVYGVASYANYQTGIWTSTNPITECWGMWPIWTSGSCVIAFSNFYRIGLSQNTWVYPYGASGSVNFGLYPNGVGVLQVTVRAGASLFGGQAYLGSQADCSIHPKQGPNVGESGLNWLTAGPVLPTTPVGTAIEVNGPTVRQSKYVYANYSPSPFFPQWCCPGYVYYSIYSESTYTIRTDDPSYGSMRSFSLWTPSPAIDELGLTLGATISVQTAV